MKRFLRLSACYLLAVSVGVSTLSAQTGTVIGTVSAGDGTSPLAGANVWIVGTFLSVLSDDSGGFSIEGVPSGSHVLKANRIGFADATLEIEVGADRATRVRVTMSTSPVALEAISVSGSRRIQKVTDAPVSLALVTARDLARRTSSGYTEVLQRVRGVDTYRTGVTNVIPNARGFTSAYNSRFRVMVDHRSGHYPSLAAPSGPGYPVNTEDIERMEVVLGPSSALYGPNAHSGLLHVITKHPIDHPGTTLVTGIGSNSTRYGRVRHAGASSRFAYKINGEYVAADDWVRNDTVAIDDAGRVYTESEDPATRIARATGSFYYFPTPDLQVVASAGYGKNDGITTTNLGRNQLVGLELDYQQIRVEAPRFFLQANRSGTGLGDTHSIENKVAAMVSAANGGGPISEAEGISRAQFIDTSTRWNYEAQLNERFALSGRSLDVIVGVQHEDVRPNSGGTVFAEGRVRLDDPLIGSDPLRQTGVYAQVEADLSERWRVVAAGRYDTHTNFEAQLSPRVALVHRLPGEGTVRLTYNRAFQAPEIVSMEALLVLGSVPGTNIPVVLRGNGRGFTMSDGRVIPRLAPERNTTWEVGYKGRLGRDAFLDVNAYRSSYENFQGPATAITDPVGGVVPVSWGGEAIPTFPEEYVLTYLGSGRARVYGFDTGLTLSLGEGVDGWINYSHMTLVGREDPENDANGDGNFDELSFNAPNNKAIVGVGLQDIVASGLYLSASARWIQEYDFIAGLHRATAAGAGTGSFQFRDRGPLGGFTTFDVHLSYALTAQAHLNLSATNVFDRELRESIGAPTIRRLLRTEIKYTIR